VKLQIDLSSIGAGERQGLVYIDGAWKTRAVPTINRARLTSSEVIPSGDTLEIAVVWDDVTNTLAGGEDSYCVPRGDLVFELAGTIDNPSMLVTNWGKSEWVSPVDYAVMCIGY
jgi:hypothetical protein